MQSSETDSMKAGMPEPDELRLAAELSRSFASSDNVDATVRLALGNVMQLLRVEAGSLFLCDDRDGDLICRASLGPNSIEGLRVPRGSGIVGRAVEEDKIEAVEDVSRDSSHFKSADATSGFVTRSILCAPMRAGRKPIGAVEVLNKMNGQPFDLKDRDMLQVMANAAALAIANARLADQLVEQERIKRELELASEIQRSLLPPRTFAVSGLDVATYYRAGGEGTRWAATGTTSSRCRRAAPRSWSATSWGAGCAPPR